MRANAEQLVYTPVNPAFGGKKSNYSYLQGTADAQNRFAYKKAAGSKTEFAQQFIEKLQTRLYSKLAQKVAATLFGNDCAGDCSGEIALGDQTVDYAKVGTEITLQITDAGGEVTTLSVPALTSSADE